VLFVQFVKTALPSSSGSSNGRRDVAQRDRVGYVGVDDKG
jgi:hypothetical protein